VAVAWKTYVALGDSFTEGMSDDLGPDGRHRGWADRLAADLATRTPDFRYANLAIRGKLLGQIYDEQVPVARVFQPDLVSIAGGVNDAMRRHFDLDTNAAYIEDAVRQFRGQGSDVLLFAFGDPGRRSRVFGVMRERLKALNSATLAIAQAHGCYVVNFWGAATFDPDDMWAEDRLHLSPLGHDRAARAALQALNVGDDEWRSPDPWQRTPAWKASSRHIAWARRHGAPWLIRRIRQESSAQGIVPKRPTPTAIDPQPMPAVVRSPQL
jgi:lysophospholipase L1-like esterase